MDHEALKVVQNLIDDMRRAGFVPVLYRVFGEAAGTIEPREMVARGDQFTIRFDKIAKPGGYAGTVVIIPGNGEDALHDFTWKATDAVGEEFLAAMEKAGY